MRKLIYSLLTISLFLTSCNSFEEYASANYGEGPTIAITVNPAITDSAFTLTLTPGTGAAWYSYVVQVGDVPVDIDAASLLKGKTYTGISSKVTNVTDNPTFTTDMRSKGIPLCLPNTTYQIYAVAANAEGVVGSVVNFSVTTTDALTPGPKTFSGDGSTNTASITFSENLLRSTGKVTATFYKEYDVANPVEVVLPEANISINANKVTIMVPDVPAGAFVNINWEAGAFTDMKGNPCAAYTKKGFSTTTGAHQGIRFRAVTVAFEVNDSSFVSPAVGSAFVDWTTFAAVIAFDFNIYRVDADIVPGDVKVIYSNSKKTSALNLTASDWSLDGKSIKFKLPSAPDFGDNIDVEIAAGVIFDVYGNPNAAYTSTTPKWSRYESIGTYTFTYESNYDAVPTTYTADPVIIVKNPSVTNGVILLDFYNKGAKLAGIYDLTTHKLNVAHLAPLGSITDSSDGTVYGLVTYDRLGATGAKGDIIFDISADETTITCAAQLAIAATTVDYATLVGYWDKLNNVALTKVVTASAVKTRVLKTKHSTTIKREKLNK